MWLHFELPSGQIREHRLTQASGIFWHDEHLFAFECSQEHLLLSVHEIVSNARQGSFRAAVLASQEPLPQKLPVAWQETSIDWSVEMEPRVWYDSMQPGEHVRWVPDQRGNLLPVELKVERKAEYLPTRDLLDTCPDDIVEIFQSIPQCVVRAKRHEIHFARRGQIFVLAHDVVRGELGPDFTQLWRWFERKWERLEFRELLIGSAFTVCEKEDAFFISGGMHGSTCKFTNAVAKFSLDETPNRLAPCVPLRCARGFHRATQLHADSVEAVGGHSSLEHGIVSLEKERLYWYNRREGQYELTGFPRHAGAVNSCGEDCVYASGGYSELEDDDCNQPTRDVWSLDCWTGRLVKLSFQLQEPRARHSCILRGRYMYVIGGEGAKNLVEQVDLFHQPTADVSVVPM